MLPDSLKTHIEETLQQSIHSIRRASGGSINEAAQLEMEDPGRCFLKWNRSADPDMFAKEVKGLELLEQADTGLVIPTVIDQGVVEGQIGYLLMEYVEQGSSDPDSSRHFGRELAALHRVQEERYGLDHDNYIGRLPQSNTWHDDWIDFFVSERMEPQLKMALDSGKFSSSIKTSFDNMYSSLEELFPVEPASLLHGDLWGGNYFYNTEGKATMYDPAVYYGHREIELAFTHLFGGFSSDFYSAYQEAYPLAPDFNSRKDIYNLYPLLVHTNMFGGHYGSRVQSIVRRFS